MKTRLAFLLVLLGIPVAAALLSASHPAPPRTGFERTPARLARGRHLFHHVALCGHCHSEIDWSKDGGPIREGRAGAGVSPFPEEDLSWLNAPNITPDEETGIGRWTDEEIARAIRQGVRPDGRVLFPLMPYPNFNAMSDEDVASIVVYLRSLPPVKHAVPANTLPPPLAASLKGLPAPAGPVAGPDPADRAAHGAYLTRIASCTLCHTPVDAQGAPRPGLDWAGGFVVKGPWGAPASANLTQDPSGIPYYDQAMFLKVIRGGCVGARELNDIMPWAYFKGMTDEELKAIWAHLRSVPPVKHRVDNRYEPKPCPRCGGAHGLGELNEAAHP